MQCRCPYCDFLGDPRGIKAHARLSHPNMVAEFGTSHLEPPAGHGGIRKELLIPENPQENRYFAKLKNIQRTQDSRKLVIVPSKNAQVEVPKMSNEEEKKVEAARHEYEYQCSDCGYEFDEFHWSNGRSCCPKCGVHLSDSED